MRLLLVPLALALLAAPSPSHAEAPKAAAPASSPDEGTLYTLGLRTARQLDQFDLSPAELETVKKGLTDGVAGKKPRFDPVAHEEKLQKFAEQRLARVTEQNRQSGQAFAAKAAKEKGAQKTATGLVFTSLKEGTGAAPTQADSVLANFEGRLIDGTVFDSSKKRGQAIQFPMAQAIPCLGEGAAKMKVGGKARLVCPASLAYGDAGRPPVIPPGATLVFELELLQVAKSPAAPPGHGSAGMPPPGGAHGGTSPGPGPGPTPPTR